ncbi:hypothetical protein ACP70R_010508 [Stipagrostis hirtigluma subsp. patula]
MDAAAAMPDDFVDIDFNLDDFDFDLAADDFCDAYDAFVADADNKRGAAPGGWLAGSGVDDDEGSGRESSPDSGVTDGPLAGEEVAMSAYVSELERLLMEDDDIDGEVACPGGGRAAELVADEYFGDLLAKGDAGGVTAADKEEEEEEDADLAAREDETASRNRARHKIKGTPMMPWRELEVTRRHLARIQVPAPWLPPAAALLCV